MKFKWWFKSPSLPWPLWIAAVIVAFAPLWALLFYHATPASPMPEWVRTVVVLGVPVWYASVCLTWGRWLTGLMCLVLVVPIRYAWDIWARDEERVDGPSGADYR